MEILQAILIISLIFLCVTLTSVSIYSVFVLKDLKETLEEAKLILKTGRKITFSVIAPLTAAMGLIGSLTKGIKAVRSISGIFDEEDEEDDEEY